MTEHNGGESDKKVPTLLGRLGNVFYWLGTGTAVLWVVLVVVVVAVGEEGDKLFWVGFFAVLAIVSWGTGRALRYILAGR